VLDYTGTFPSGSRVGSRLCRFTSLRSPMRILPLPRDSAPTLLLFSLPDSGHFLLFRFLREASTEPWFFVLCCTVDIAVAPSVFVLGLVFSLVRTSCLLRLRNSLESSSSHLHFLPLFPSSSGDLLFSAFPPPLLFPMCFPHFSL